MKRKTLSVLMVVVIVCLALSMIVLSACNPKDDHGEKPQTPSTERNTSDMLTSIWENLQASYQVGEQFGVDVSASFVIDDKTAKDNDVTYTLVAKGNANLKDSAKDGETAFVLELTKKAKTDAKATTLLGVAYEVIDNEPYFFGNVMGEYRKINGYSVTALYRALTKNQASTAADFDISTILPTAISVLFGSTGTVENNVYTLNFSLSDVVEQLSDLWTTAGGSLLSMIGITQDQLDGYVKQIFGNLAYTTKTGEVNVETLDDLFTYLQSEISFDGTLAFKFDANDKFESANLSFDYDKKDTPIANYTIAIDKAFVGTTTTPVDTFANFALDSDARRNNEAINALNFSVFGTATGYKGENIAHNYTIEVQSDINPFALFALVGNTGKENIVDTLKKLGYFHLEINEVFEDETKSPLNIITLHSNFEEGFAVVNVHTYGAIIYKAGVGGVYDFEALVDVIDMLVNKPSDPGEEPGEQPGDDGNVIDKIKDIVNTVKEYLAFFNFEGMTENGVTFEIKNLVMHLLDSLGVDTEGLIGTGVASLIGSETMNVKLQTPTFNSCAEKVDTDSIVCTIREASALKNGKNDFIKEIVSLDGLALKAFKNTDTNNYATADALGIGKAFAITGINLNGEEVATSGYVMGVKGLDLGTVGKQNVTIYIAIANDVLDLSRAGLVLGDDIPIAGTLKFETEFEVLDPSTVTAESIALADVKIEDVTLLYTDKVFDKIKGSNPMLNINGIYRVIDADNMKVVDKDGNNVEIVDGKIAQGGAYRVYFETAGFKSQYINVDIESAYAKRSDGQAEVSQLVLGEEWDYDAYEAYVVTKDGETKQDVTATFQIGSVSGVDKIFDITENAEGNKIYTLKKNLEFAGKNLTITFKVTIAGKKNQNVKVEIPVVCDEGYVVSKAIALTHYIGNSVNGGFEITKNGVVYSVVWNGAKFEAVAEDGSKLADFDMSLNWDTRKIAVELDAQGRIVNVANKNAAGSRTEKITATITIGEYTYSKTFTHYELYASNRTSHAIAKTLDGYISSVGNIDYVDDNGEEQSLEFKYGAEGYAIYVKGTDTKVYNVNVTVTKDGTEVQLVDGKFSETGKYRVSYTIDIDGINQTFYHDVTVK